MNRCSYCDFVSGIYSPAKELVYIQSLKKEILNISHEPLLTKGSRKIASLYIGGGTPTTLSAHALSDIICHIVKHLPFEQHCEATIEANPGTLDKEKLRSINACGINRISIGVQSFHDDELKFLGRPHTAYEAEQAICLAHKTGFENCNIDLIYGIPGQNIQSWGETLQMAVSLKPKHISSYELSIIERTVLHEQIKNQRLKHLDESEIIQMYEHTIDYLESQGYHHYEISNFAQPKYFCAHNLNYWNQGEYYGVGLGAHSFIEGKRYFNTDDFERYIQITNKNKSPVKETEELTKKKALSEALFLGLRKTEGMDIKALSELFDEDILTLYKNEIHELKEAGLIEMKSPQGLCCLPCPDNSSEASMRLTRKGFLLSNEVFSRFL
jgi:oxygen-independent coproporphyrinogen-3 oxidase